MSRARIERNTAGNGAVPRKARQKPGSEQEPAADGPLTINGTGWSPAMEDQWLALAQKTLRQQTARQPHRREVFKKPAERGGLAGGDYKGENGHATRRTCRDLGLADQGRDMCMAPAIP